MLIGRGLARMYYKDLHRRLDRLEKKFAQRKPEPVQVVFVDHGVELEAWGPDGHYEEYDLDGEVIYERTAEGRKTQADDYEERRDAVYDRIDAVAAYERKRIPYLPAQAPPILPKGIAEPTAEESLAAGDRQHPQDPVLEAHRAKFGRPDPALWDRPHKIATKRSQDQDFRKTSPALARIFRTLTRTPNY